MSGYDNRKKPAYSIKGNPSYLKNKYILNWWTNEHDDLLL